MDPLVISIACRSIERIIIILIGGLSVYLGWALFKLPIPSDSGAEIKHGQLQIVLRRIGPGVFFALFGTAVTVFSIAHPTHFEEARKSQKPPGSQVANDDIESRQWSGAGGGNRDLFKPKVRALNTAIKAIGSRGDDNLNRAALNDLAHAEETLRLIRDELIERQFGSNLVDLWNSKGEDYQRNPNSLPIDERQKLAEISNWYRETMVDQMMEGK